MRHAVLALAACTAASPPAPRPLANARAAPPGTTVLTLSRTECLGNACPVYTVEIATDGAVHWHGEAAVATVGDAHASIAVADVQRLLGAFADAGFFTWKDPGPRFRIERVNGKPVTIVCTVLDASSTIVTIVRDGTPVRHEWSPCGGELDRADKLVDQVVGTRRWIGH